jgi:hypothetical protein
LFARYTPPTGRCHVARQRVARERRRSARVSRVIALSFWFSVRWLGGGAQHAAQQAARAARADATWRAAAGARALRALRKRALRSRCAHRASARATRHAMTRGLGELLARLRMAFTS